ncbi:MAG: hypothetical protein IPL46_14370 [Saprospiraceae bacterium]|nr:hypothetical protein [Saprospiraceae bacterium]
MISRKAVTLCSAFALNQSRQVPTSFDYQPSLNTESQIALKLKTLCRFGVQEVAHALLTTESTINKRLFRAKKNIRDSNDVLSIPQGAELESRLDTVCLTLYLLFNEGYNSSSSDSIIRRELVSDAMRLCKLVFEHFEY